ncbi:MAG: hypothetical protein Q9191_003029 [Dirinaria sp. TL-2023a]
MSRFLGGNLMLRKCGRVVCANCSPHRITIPRQYIVHPPDQSDPGPTARTGPATEVIDLTEDGEDSTRAPSHVPDQRNRRQGRDRHLDPALGGGREVRLCNPCVPDPNPLPHLYASPARTSLDSFPRPESAAQNTSSSIAPPRSSSMQHRLLPQSNMGTSGQRNYDMGRPPSSQRHGSQTLARVSDLPIHTSAYGSAPDSTLHNRQLAALLRENRPSRHQHRHHASMGSFPDYYPHRSMMDAAPFPQPRPLPPPQLREEDECPICHSALPPKGPNGSETAREQHVTECIEAHFSTSGPSTAHPPPSAATEAAVAASAATPSQAGSIAGLHDGSGSLPSPSFAQRRRTTGMVVYRASEKDCVGEDGEGAQECVICFEEFAVGDEMGRLECLCKFHKVLPLG